ncbi:hypothetical protein [Pseudofrankia sp. BMG5.37]|uniref:hypothetical protein n=1 Tax=Pseudofrankia sp. BMG5.37 TaxID=3050035 RepID=UPI002893AA3E|nr:hypothetical protein [Pseudofrankia sp. BMG5.37]MDT3443828.1 hypothetical protein [Pseudofrankia sp. BMG5.37]
MSGWDATIKLLHPVDLGTDFEADTVSVGGAFDVIADVEVGEELMGFAGSYDLWVKVRNLSTSTMLAADYVNVLLTPIHAPWRDRLHRNIPGGWIATEGDVLEVLASFKMNAGVHHDYSSAISQHFIVTA